MANFEVTYREGSEIKRTVLTATDEAAAGKAFGSAHQGISADNVISVKNLSRYDPKYGTANFITTLISFIGWITLVLGIIGAVGGISIAYSMALGTVQGQGVDAALRPMLMSVGLGVSGFSFLFALIGLLMAAAGQHLRATTDAANSLCEILLLLKSSKA